LADGLTANDKPMKFSSPKGSMLRGKMLMTRGCGLRSKVKGAIIINCYRNELTSSIPVELQPKSIDEKLLLLITKPIGSYYYKIWKK
jgi:hypothetical protein